MNTISAAKAVAIGNHHSPLPQAVQTSFQRLTIHRRRQFFPHQIQSILVRSVNWLGDAILTLPAIRQLKQFFPEASLTVMALARVAPVFSHVPEVDQGYSLSPQTTGHWSQRLARLALALAAGALRSGRDFSQLPGISAGTLAPRGAAPGGL